MPVNKVIYGGVTLLDLTKDTVTAEKLLKGETAHGKDGEPIVGTFEASTITVSDNGDGNIVIESLYPLTFTDDGNGNLIGETVSKTTSTDNSGNITME